MNKRLFRSRQEKVIGGVCGGIAEYYDIDPTIVRLATILLVLGLGFPVVAYLVGWIIIPRRPLVAVHTDNAHTDQTVNKETTAADTAPMAYPGPNATEAPDDKSKPGMSAMIPGMVMVALGLFALLKGYFWWHWDDLIPVGLVVIGIYLIVRHLDLSIISKRDSDTHVAGATEFSATTATVGATTTSATPAPPTKDETSSDTPPSNNGGIS